MTSPTEPPMDTLSPVKQALLELRDLRARLAQAESARHEPIAIIGMAVRAPGDAWDPAAFWALLREGRDAVTETPASRWDNATLYDADPDAPGKVSTRRGGFLRDVDQFDAAFFGISRREAESMDPQHRILLEVTWEALERAGIAPDSLAGSDAGFFLGISNSDYWRALYADPATIDVYAGMGGALSVAAGRLAYFLGTHGPTLSVDTACSSSLVSLHLACQSLRLGETSLAVAGGVSLMLSPEATINFSKARMLAPDGRCKTFDAAADGYVRSDGCAMLVLKRLRAARADGDHVLAIIRGSAVNQDGRSNGLTAPHGPAQEAVMRSALASAQVASSAVQYVEAHGTGTPLGDPIELRALGAVYGAGRSAHDPLIVGTVKTNLGHLEAAAGVIGVVKTVLALQREWIPAHLHVSQPTPLVDWHALRVRLPAAGGDAWPRGATPRIAAVSSFGFSGTNAHLILEEGDLPVVAAPRPDAPVCVVPLSGRTAEAVRTLAARYVDAVSGDGTTPAVSMADLAHTAGVARAHLRWARHAVVARDSAEVGRQLRRVAEGAVVVAQPGPEARPRVAFLFTGHGAQFSGMGRDLYETVPLFRDTIDRCSAEAQGQLGHSIPDILWGANADVLLADTRFSQPAIVSLEVALAAVWQSWGVQPAVIAGHSLGEFAAAVFAGVLSLGDALRLVMARAALVDTLPVDVGAMTVVAASRSTVDALVGGFRAGAVELAADNGPAQVVLTGPAAALRVAETALSDSGIEHRRLVGIRHAFHSAQLDEVLPGFAAQAAAVTMHAPHTAWISGVTGTLLPAGQAPAANYWAQQTRNTVQFREVAHELLRLGVTACIEVGPHPVLSAQVAEVAAQRADDDTVPLLLPSLRRGNADWPVLAESVAQWFAAGGEINWRVFTEPYAGARVDIPTYPFERKRYWLRGATAAPMPAATSAAAQRWISMQRRALRQAGQAPIGVDVTGVAGHWSLLAQLSSALIVDTLRRGGVFTAWGERATLADVSQRAGIVAAQHRLLERWLHRLADEGVLVRDDDAWISPRPLPVTDVAALLAQVERQLLGDPALLAYVRSCALQLHDVMTGRASALDTLFPGGSYDIAEGLYTRATSARYINALAASAIASLGEIPPERRRPRVLEIGSGTGGTTAALVEQLAGYNVEYWFTDVSDSFLGRAAERFGDQVALRTAVFDADRSGAEQGIPLAAFDVVTAANALHAAKHLPQAIAHVRELLAPGGVLLLVETTTHHAWFDISTGLIEGWQHFADGLRTDIPLLSAAAWHDALRDGGFDEVVSVPAEGSLAAAMGQRVILARVRDDAVVAGVREETDVTDASRATVSAPASAPPTGAAARDVLQSVAPSERLGVLHTAVRDAVIDVLRRSADEPLDLHARLMEEGVDSLMAVQLRGTLSRSLQIEPPLPATLIFEHPTIDAIARHLLSRVFQVEPERAAAPSPAPATVIAADAARTMSDAEIAALLEQRYGNASSGSDARHE
jgi:acyl transferase domain-containing protein/SAM-dependent methyltransferase